MNNLTLPCFFLNFLFRLGVDQDSIYGAVFGMKNVLCLSRRAPNSYANYINYVIMHYAKGYIDVGDKWMLVTLSW